MRYYLIGGLAILSAILGCTREEDFKISVADFGFETRRADAFPTNAPKKIATMAPDDVIVAVNGYPLRKRVYDDLMELKQQGLLKQKDMNNLAAEQMMDDYRMRYVTFFQAQRMLVDEAFRQNIVTTNEVMGEILRRLKKEAKRRGITIEKSLKPYGKARKYIFQDLFTSIVIDKFVALKIPPKREVDERFVQAVQDQVTKDNESAAATNANIVAYLNGWRKQIMEGKMDFIEVAKRFAGESDADDGIWGSFEEGDMDDPKVEAAVFSLPKGAISDVLEDFNGYQLVKVLDITPAETNEKGRVVSKEIRKLSRVYVDKVPVLERVNNVKMTSELKRQMQLQTVDEYVTFLSTNGTTRIEFPNGNNLFSP